MNKKTKKRLLLSVAILFFPIGVPFLIRNYIRKKRSNKKVKKNYQNVRSWQSSKVEALATKLWGGFGTQASKDLHRLISKGSTPNNDSYAAIETLAAWYASANNWSIIGSLVTNHDAAKFSARTQLILVEALIQTNQPDNASKLLETFQKLDHTNLAIAKANVANLKGDTNASIEALNQLYRRQKLTELITHETSEPINIANLRTEHCEKVHRDALISVLIPCYNAEDTIGYSIQSILNQSWQNIEVIVVDDDSSDASFEIVSALVQQDSRIRLFKNDTNLGAYPTRNRALSLAAGALVTVHDSDDWSHPSLLAEQAEPLLNDPSIHGTFSNTIRSNTRLKFSIRPSRPKIDYIHRSYASFMVRRIDAIELGGWDDVTCNADDEFVRRLTAKWGADALEDVAKQAPLKIQLMHDQSLTQTSQTSLNTLNHGLRLEYTEQAKRWLNTVAPLANYRAHRKSTKHPFPIPPKMAPKNWGYNSRYDLIIISDLSLLGGTRRCNEGYINAALALGWRVGIYNWPYYPFSIKPIAEMYYDFTSNENFDILVPEDDVNCNLLLIHHPPIFAFEMDRFPKISTSNIGILVNQCPMQLKSQEPNLYDIKEVDDRCVRLFGSKPTWISISQRVKDILTSIAPSVSHLDAIWSPPYNGILAENCPKKNVDPSRIVIGRHSRDHWTKWPQDSSSISSAYLVNHQNIKVEILGGAEVPLKMLTRKPRNWHLHDFDSISVNDFLSGLDFFVNFVHPDYIEEFGRNVMEAMAAGIVVILSKDFRSVFGDAALYCEPSEVETMIQKYAANTELYHTQAGYGFDYVKTNCDRPVVIKKLSEFSNS